jgi:hypothetical protein
MNLDDITPLVLTWNEELNIGRTLAALSWARRILVVDSYSDDRTAALVAEHPRTELLQRKFDTFADQCAFGQAQVCTSHTLSLDADHAVSPQLLDELRSLDPNGAEAWVAPFVYCVGGRPLRASLLPPRIVLFRTAAGRYENDGHGHRVCVDGRVAALRRPILHDDRKPLRRWVAAQVRYAGQEADKLCATAWRGLGWADRLRRWHLAPLLIVPYCLLVRGLILDGRPGWHYALQRLLFEVLLSLMLLDRRLAGTGHEP